MTPEPMPGPLETAIMLCVVAVLCVIAAVKLGGLRKLCVWLGFREDV